MTGAAAAGAGWDEAALRRGLRLARFIIAWDLAEGIVAVTAGVLAGSIALVGFGINSGIEVFAAAVTAWHLRGGGRAGRGVALRLIALSLLGLAAYVAYGATNDLLSRSKAETSTPGIALNAVALAAMLPAAILPRRAGRPLGNDVLDARQ